MALTKVAGDILDPGLSIAGVVTATAFDGPFRGGSGSDIIAGVGTFTELDVNGNADFSGNVTIGGSFTVQGDYTTLNTTLRNVELLRVSAASTFPAGIVTQTGTGDILNLFDGTTEVLTVTDGGKVGIGTDTPTNEFEVFGAGTVGVFKGTGGNAFIGLLDVDAGAGYGYIGSDGGDLLFQTPGSSYSTKLQIKSGGNIGINTTNPQTELEVFSDTSSDITIHSARTSGHIGGINFANGASAAGIVTAQYFVGTAGHHYWHCNGTERLKLENDGDLTITGVDNAELKLKCGASTGNNILAFLNSAGATKGRIYYDSDNNFMVFNTDGTSDERMRITNTGLVLVGTTTEGHSSADDLTINNSGHGGITIRTGTTSNGAIFFSDATSGAGEYDGYVQYNHGTDPYMLFGVDQNERLRITDVGNLKLPDDAKVELGGGQTGAGDLQLWHDAGAHSYIRTTNTGQNLYLQTTDSQVILGEDGGQIGLIYNAGAAIVLRHNNSQKFTTSETGVTVTGEVAASQDYPNYRPKVDWNFAAVKKLDSRLTYKRTGPASYVDEFGIVKLVGDNVPRFDHDSETGELKGLLIEPSRTSRLTQSTHNESYSDFRQTDRGETIKGPDGVENSAREYTVDSNGSTGGSTTIWANQAIGIAAATSFSCFLKITRGTTMAFRLYDNNNNQESEKITISGGYITDGSYATVVQSDPGSTEGTTTYELYPNGWVRMKWFGVSGSANSTSYLQLYIYDHAAANSDGDNIGYAVWGFQVENGAFCTSPIYKPTTAAVTRGTDFTYLDGADGTEFDDIHKKDEGTFILDWFNDPQGNHNDGYVFTVDDGSGNNRIGAVNSNGYQVTVTSGGSSQGNRDLGSINSGANKMAFTYKLNDQATSLNGSDASVDTSCTLPTGLKYWWFGLRQGQYDMLGGYIRRFIYYPMRLPNNQLKNLSS